MPKIQHNSLQYLIIYTAGYVFWDFLYRNEKYNKNQTPAYKFLQTADLAIFNVMSICVTSGCALALAKIPIYLAKLKIRSRIPLFAVSSIIFLVGIVIAAKLTDMAIDICLDYTFRKHLFNYKEKFTGWDCNDTI
jgi:hypothetical protein